MEVSQKAKHRTTLGPGKSTLEYISGKKIPQIRKYTGTSMFKADVFKIAKYGSNPNVHQQTS